ncbi:MAG: serine hydrolase [Gemmatimonadota bacterium]
MRSCAEHPCAPFRAVAPSRGIRSRFFFPRRSFFDVHRLFLDARGPLVGALFFLLAPLHAGAQLPARAGAPTSADVGAAVLSSADVGAGVPAEARLPARAGVGVGVGIPAPEASRFVDVAALDAYFARAQKAWPVPGFSVAIVQGGKIVLEKGYGVRDVRRDDPVDGNTLYAIASNSKAFTAAALAQLVDEGKLDWDDRVVDHLPWFRLYAPYVTQDMRIRDLLSHRSGLGTFSGDLLWYGTGYSAREVVRRARYLKPAYPFRAGYGYSNLMFIAAGEVLRAVSGEDWHERIPERFFEPLGMHRSVTSTRVLEDMDNVATPHKNERGKIVPLEWYNWDAMGAAGGIISSVHDMSLWLRAQLNHGVWQGKRIFSEDAQRQMWRVHNPFAVTPAYRERYPSTHFRGYGLGWSLADYKGRMIVSHGGGYDGMYSQVVLVPEENLGIVVLTNAMTGIAGALTYRVLDAYLGGDARDWSAELLPGWKRSRERFHARQDSLVALRAPGTGPSLELEAYAGTYGGDLYGDAKIGLEDGHLVLRLLPNPDLVADLEHLRYDTFLIRWRKTFAWFGPGAATFVLDETGRPVELRLNVPNNDLWFHELELRRR